MTWLFLLALVLLLALNALFVLAEFAAVKIRASQIEVLKDKHPAKAALLGNIHRNLDEYLSVCQLGITFASIGLGFVGEPAVARLLAPLIGHGPAAHAVAIIISYLLVSYLHILLGEQVPKVFAIRNAEHMALWTAPALRISRLLLYLPLLLLNNSANFVLRLLGMGSMPNEAAPSMAELRVILEQTQEQGLIPFRRLLLIENVFDFGEVRVKDEMRPMDQVASLHLDHPWEEARDRILASPFSRFPLLEGSPPRVVGIVHLKDLLHRDTPWPDPVDLRAIARKTYVTTPEMPVEQLLTELRKRRVHMAMVQEPTGQLIGVITLEDILEQLVGAIEDEFERDTSIRLTDAIREDRIILDLEATDAPGAIAEIIQRAATADVPLEKRALTDQILARERSLSTYLGQGLAVPHARVEGLKSPVAIFARSKPGIYFGPKPEDRAGLLFVLLTPSSQPRAQVRLLARIASLRESDYVWERLGDAADAAQVLDAIRSGEEMAIP